jgi:single-strand DNA-binding protein
MLNKVILIGRTTRDVELRRTASGTPVASFTLAVDRYSKEDNNRSADFINCVAWNRTAEVMEQYVKKGMLIAVEGRIQTRDYENTEGKKVYITEVVCDNMKMLESKGSNNSASYSSDYEPTNSGYQKDETSDAENSVDFNISEDDLPF